MKSVSVTTALSPFADFSMVPEHVLALATERGIVVHRACACHALSLYQPSIPMEFRGYFQSFKTWFDQYVDHVFFVEAEFSDPDLGFHGHPDIGARLIDGRCVIPDYKTAAVESPTWRAQIAAYRHLANLRHGGIFLAGMALMLRKDGRPAKGILYQDSPADFALFLSALNCWRGFLNDNHMRVPGTMGGGNRAGNHRFRGPGEADPGFGPAVVFDR